MLWIREAESRHKVSYPEAIPHLPGACRNLPGGWIHVRLRAFLFLKSPFTMRG